jgi:hypothetical protein
VHTDRGKAVIRAALALVLVVGIACGKSMKQEAQAELDEMFADFQEFSDSMCTCIDKTCADGVQEAVTKWSTILAAKRSNANVQPSEAAMTKCMTRAMSPPPPEAPPLDAPPTAVSSVIDAPSTIDAPRAHTNQPKDVAAPVTVDELLVLVRTWAREEHEQLRITEIDVEYVAADGMLDPEHGRLAVKLGRAPQIVDDSTRRTGAPVKPLPSQPSTCMGFEWTAPGGWIREFRYTCQQAALPFPRCLTTTIWKRAIAKGAPADAVAVLHIDDDEKPRYWSFSITDEPRKIKINYYINDDCKVVLEKP